MKRIALFALTNMAVLLVVSIVLRVLGVGDPAQYGSLLIFAAIFGMGGSFVSLLMSKWVAKRSMRVHVIAEPQNDTERWLVNTVSNLARASNIGMPEVGIF